MTWTTEAVVHESYKSPVTSDTETIPVDEHGNLGPKKVLVKTEYASINPVDIKSHASSLLNGKKHTLKDFAGEVIAVGKDAASRFKVGEKVWGSIYRPSNETFVGSLTLADISADVISTLPAKLTTEQAASIGVVFGTAFQSSQRAESYGQKFGPDSSVLVLGGATVVGSYTIQLAKKYFNIGTVVATCSSHSAEYVKSMGADVTIDYHKGNLRDQFVDYVTKQAGGKKFDAILDAVGGYDAVAVFPSISKPASTGAAYISVMGDGGPKKTYAGTMTSAISCSPWSLFRQFFGKYYGINYQSFLSTHGGGWVEVTNEVFSIPGFKVSIDSVYPIADLKAAWAKVDSTRARGKVVSQF